MEKGAEPTWKLLTETTIPRSPTRAGEECEEFEFFVAVEQCELLQYVSPIKARTQIVA